MPFFTFRAARIFRLTNHFFGVKLIAVKRVKKIIATCLPIPFLFAITFCCCLKEEASADEHNANFSTAHHHASQEQESQEVGKSHQSEPQHHPAGDDGCSCPKHLSFLSQQPLDVNPDLSSFQLLAKSFLALPSFDVFLLSSSSLHSPDPPGEDHRDQVTISIFLKNSNIRI